MNIHIFLFIGMIALFVFIHIQCSQKDYTPSIYVDNKVKIAVTQDGCRTIVPYDFIFTDPGCSHPRFPWLFIY